MSKKKAFKSAFYGSAGGFFFQKKKVILENIKHSGNEKNIFLSKSGSSDNIYSNVESLFNNNKNVSMSNANSGSLLSLAATTLKTKQVNTGAVFGFPLSFPNFSIDDYEVVLSFCLPISFNKKWIDLKIIKTSVEVSIKKLFALDINLSAVKEKSVTAKTQLVRKIFSLVNGFGKATTLLKFEGIIKSTFILEKSIKMAILLAREKKININSNLKRQRMRSDQAVVIKKIFMNTLKDMIITTVFEFGEIKSIKIQLIGIWQKAVVEFAELDQANLLVSKDWLRALLFILPIRTTAHDLGTLLKRTGKKTCIINRSIETGNRIYCAVIGFNSDDDLEFAFCTEPIFALECNTSNIFVLPLSKKSYKKIALEEVCFQLTKLYKKKDVSISHSTVFSSKSWAQVVSLANFSSSTYFKSSSSFFPLSGSSLGGILFPISTDTSGLSDYLAVLECSLELLLEQIFVLLKKLSFMELVPLNTVSFAFPPVVSVSLAPVLNLDMVLNNVLMLSVPSFSADFKVVADFSSSSSKVLTTKMGGLESKIVVLEVSINLVLGRLDHLCSGLNLLFGLENCYMQCSGYEQFCEIADKFVGVCVFTFSVDSGYLGSGVAIIMDISLAYNVCKISKISGQFLFVRLLFKNKLSVLILGLYTDVSSMAVNEFSFVIFGGNFNENGSCKCVNFQKCLDLGLVNSLVDSSAAVSVSVGLSGLLNTQLNFICKQANKNYWKFDFKGADENNKTSFSAHPTVLNSISPMNILESSGFGSVCDWLSWVAFGSFLVYMDSSLKNLNMINKKTSAVVFFEDIGLGLGVNVSGLMFSTLAEMQAIALAMKCILSSSSVCLFLDNQSALDACKLELGLVYLDFHNQYWIECWHIVYSKNLRVLWLKIKGHFSVLENKHANALADTTSLSG
ncbi:hypothetical protein G9A89_012819 [Geosiphon pyriformis]|nr:hypothetical protein G9A89_012819 [Geosiphon pyriformis]